MTGGFGGLGGFAELGRSSLWRGHFFAVEELRLRAPTGEEITRDVVRHPGAVGVVADAGDHVVLVDQYRAAPGRTLLEIPAGKLDVAGEEPLICAQRELVEEIGATAEQWEHLSSFSMSPGFCDEVLHCYWARGLSRVDTNPQGEEEKALLVVTLPWPEVKPAIADGRISDAKTIIGLLLALDRRAAS